MADIVNPQAVRFTNEHIRPLAEEIRALKARVDATLVEWTASIAANVPNDTSPLADGRDAEGVSRLTGADVNGFIALLGAMQTRLNQAGTAQIVAKPCVRALEAR
jgi:hypothetical protein